jgi:FkbM family methyltransferase
MRGVICIGANLGQEIEGWLSMGVKYFILFEPVKATFLKLERIMKNKSGNYVLHNIALGNQIGSVEMYVEDCHQGKSSSILEPYLHLDQYPDIEFDKRETVIIDKLDNVHYNRRLYDHLHIDTQGYELEVLRGAEKSLQYIDTIECEVYKKELYKGCPMIYDVTQFLSDQEFELKEVFWKGLSWGDAKFERL